MLEFIRNIFTSKRSASDTRARLSTSVAWRDGVGEVAVTGEHQAMGIAAVYRCVDILSSSVACLPFRKLRLNRAEGYFLEVDGKGDRTNHIIGVQPSSHLNAFDFMKNAVAQILLQGNAYIVPRWGSDGTLSELILCTPHTVLHSPETDVYTVNDIYNGIMGETFSCRDIIHLKNMSLDGGRTGVSTIRYAAHVLGIQATTDLQTRNLFSKGGRVKGIIGNNTGLRGFGEYQDQELDRLADAISKRFNQGADIISLPGEVVFTPISMTAIDMQLLETRKFGVQEICRFFGVHPDRAFAGTSGNYKASDMAQVGFIQDTLQPMLRKIEAEFEAKLIPSLVSGEYKFRFDLSPLFITDMSTEADYMTKTIAAGVMTVNEWRRRKGLKPVDGGDKPMITCNVAPIDSEKILGGQTASSAQKKKRELRP